MDQRVSAPCTILRDHLKISVRNCVTFCEGEFISYVAQHYLDGLM
jgi:hypothetical protein